MSIRNGLVATSIVDKNGKTMTVYKKPSSATAGTSLPSPILTVTKKNGNELRDVLIGSLAEKFHSRSSYRSETSKASMTGLKTTLGKCSDDVLLALDVLTEKNETSKHFLELQIRDGVSAAKISDMATFFPEEPEYAQAAVGFIWSLKGNEELPRSRCYSKESDEVVDQCKALLRVSFAMSSTWATRDKECFTSHESLAGIIKDKRIVKLVMDDPECSYKVADFIKHRGSIDYDLIEAIVRNESSSLNNGLL